MKKMLLSSIAAGIFCCCSMVFGMDDNVFFEEEDSSQSSISGKQSASGVFSKLKKEKNISFSYLSNFSGSDSGKLSEYSASCETCITIGSDKGEIPKIIGKNELKAKQFGKTEKSRYKSDDVYEPGVAKAIKQFRANMQKTWLTELAHKSASDIFDDKASGMFDNLKEAYSKMDLLTLLKGENIKEGAPSYFVWLSVVQDHLEDLGSFDKLIGSEFNGVKRNREYLQKACDDLNERLDDIKNSTNCFEFNQKMNFNACCDIVRSKVNGIKKQIANEQLPSQEFLSSINMEYLEKMVDFMEENASGAKLALINQSDNDMIKIMLQSQINNVYRLLSDYEKDTNGENTRIDGIRNELLSIITCQNDFLHKQERMNNLMNIIFASFARSLKNNKEEDKKESSAKKETHFSTEEKFEDDKNLNGGGR